MRYLIVGEMGVWEQTALKESINGVLVDYEIERGSVIVWQIYDCPVIPLAIIEEYGHLEFISM